MKILFFDLESTDLSASWGRILCSSFATSEGAVFTYRGDKRPYKGKRITDDSKLCVKIRDELESSDIICSWNGILFDVPLLNARLAYAGERTVRVGERHGTWHLDLMYYAGGQSLRVGGRKLDTVARFFGTQNQKTPLNGELWQDAATGDRKAMDKIVEHCEADVAVLRDLFPKLAPHVKKITFNLSEVFPYLDSIPSRRI